jgi:hypothetical protein
MLRSTQNLEGGMRLRAERLRVCLSSREVQTLSLRIAKEKNNQDYYISHGWLTDTEYGKFAPNIYKLYSLSLIYKCSYDEIVGFFGINFPDIAREQRSVRMPNTHLVGSAIGTPGQTVQLPVELSKKVELSRTNLVSRMFETWGAIPVALLQQINLQHSLCGYIGLKDHTLYPLIRPGSFVEIDSRQSKVTAGCWQDEFDRPIYFVELRRGYACSWCELNNQSLILLPCPQSPCHIRQLRFPSEADIIGRVTAVTMRIAEEGNQSKNATSRGDQIMPSIATIQGQSETFGQADSENRHGGGRKTAGTCGKSENDALDSQIPLNIR